MPLDELMFKDLGANLVRGLRLIKMLNFDKNAGTGPVRAEIATSSACNYRCCFCHAHTYLRPGPGPSTIMSDNTLNKVIDDLRILNVKELLFSGDGEPLLCKGLINVIKQYGKYFKIEVLTNGSSLEMVDEYLLRNLSYLTISINSGNGASHQVTHGYKGENRFPEIAGNIERLVKYERGNDKVKLNYAITSDNNGELDDFFRKAIDWNVIFMARPVSVDFTELKPKGLTAEMLRGVSDKAQAYPGTKKLTGKIRLSFQLLSRACDLAINEAADRQKENASHIYPCYMSFIQPYITAGGDVQLCSEGEEKPLGNLNKESFISIWKNRDNIKTRISCALMDKTQNPYFSACAGCANVLYHSATFHSIYSRIPVLPARLAAKAK